LANPNFHRSCDRLRLVPVRQMRTDGDS
jgi:hypothetical protein